MSNLQGGHKRKISDMSDAVKGEFDSDEETKIFGKRRVVEIHGGVFECVTLSLFEVHDVVPGCQKINSMSGPDKAIVAINKTINLHSFSEKKETQMIKLDSYIECICCTQDGTLMIAALANGAILVYNLIENVVVCTKKVENSEETGGQTFSAVCCLPQESCTYIFASTTFGKIVKLTITQNSSVDMSEVNVKEMTYIADAAIVFSSFGTPNLILGGTNIVLYSAEDLTPLAEFPLMDKKMQVKRFCFCPNINCLLALFNNGCVMMLCPETLVCFNILDTAGLVKKLALITSSEDSPEQLIILSELGSKLSITMMETDGFQEVFSFAVGEMVHLVEQFGNSNDIMFLENDDRDSKEYNLMLRTISKSQPEFRLQRLMRQQKYSEAIAFASRYQLDMQQVHKAEVTHYINTKIKEDTAVKLKEALLKIDDCHFIAECCLKAIMPDWQQTIELLNYGWEKVAGTENAEHLLEQLSFARQKLETFFLVSSTDFSNWEEFYKGDLMMDLIFFLNEGKIGDACIMWRRHQTKFMESLLTDENIPSLLDVIPTSVEPDLFLTWFELFAPSVLKGFPQTFDELTAIAVKKIQKFSGVSTAKWPNEALDFCIKSIQILQPEDLNELSGWLIKWQNQSSSSTSPFKELQSLHKSLSDLALIQKQLHVKLSLDEYNQLKNVDGLHNLLRKTNHKNFAEFVNNFTNLVPLESGLDCEEVISSYIEFEVHSFGPAFGTSQLEERLTTLYDCLTSPEKMTHCANEILKNATIPWSKQMEAFAEKVEETSDIIANVVKVQRRMARVKQLLVKYELQHMLNLGENLLDVNYILRAIFHHQLPDMLQDALTIAKIKPSLKIEVHSLYIEHLLNKFEMRNAHQHFKSLNSKDQEQFCERFICKAEALIAYDCVEDCVEIAGFLNLLEREYNDLLEKKTDPCNFKWDKLEMSERIKKITDAVKAFEKYSIRLFTIMEENSEKPDFEQIVKEDSQDENSCRLISKVSEIGGMMNLTQAEVNLKLAAFNWSEEKIDLLRKILLENTSWVNMTSKEVDLLLELSTHIQERNQPLVELLKIALSDALQYCPLERIVQLLGEAEKAREMADLLNRKGCIVSLHELSEGEMMSSKDPFKSWCFSPIYDDLPINVASSAKTLSVLHNISVDQLGAVDVQESFVRNLDLMQIQHCDLLALSVLCRFKASVKAEEELLRLVESRKKVVIYSLLNKILFEKKADLALVLHLLQMLSPSEAQNYLETTITSVINDCNRLFRMSQLGIDFALIMKRSENIPQLAKFLTFARWGKKVKKLGQDPRGLMSPPSEDKGKVLQKIMLANPEESIETMFEFCRDFRIDVNTEIINLIQSMILEWKPQVNYETNELDNTMMVIVRDKRFERKLISLVRRLSNTHYTSLDSKLDRIWDKLNPYHYEMYECMLTIKKLLNPEFEGVQSDVLLFLESYRRTMPPKELELEKWTRNYCEGTPLPKIAEVRLPFPSFQQEIGNIIKAEVNLKNYQTWLNAPSVLNCDPGQICSSAITNAVGTEVYMPDKDLWDPGTRDNFVSEIFDCVNYIEDLPGAAAILDYASKRIPLSQDRTSLIELCQQKLDAAREENIPIDDRLAERVAKKFLLYTVVHLLHEHNLARPEYLDLATKPQELINALYKDNSIIERIKGGVGSYPDIHAIVGHICHVAEFDDVDQIRFEILSSLLFPDSGGSGSLDESFVDATMAWNHYHKDEMASADENNANLLKAQYMLEAGRKQDHVDYILSICNNDKIAVSNGVRLRAWRLLLWLVPIEEISAYTDLGEDEIIEKLTNMYFITELEAVQGQSGITLQQFKATDKASVVEGLLRNLSSNPRALILMAKLCLHFKIQNMLIWGNILSQMVRLQMHQELEGILPKLSAFVFLFGTEVFEVAWSNTVQVPFSKADSPMTAKQYELCIKSLMLLQMCPIPCRLAKETIFDICLTKDAHELAAVLLPSFLPKTGNLCQKLLQKIQLGDLNKKLAKLSIENPGLPVLQAQEILEYSVSKD